MRLPQLKKRTGNLSIADHAMDAVDEMSVLNEDFKKFDEVWRYIQGMEQS